MVGEDTIPWTRQQVKFLFSSGSPLKPEQKEKMHEELHENPSMGHMRKGFHKSVFKKARERANG